MQWLIQNKLTAFFYCLKRIVSLLCKKNHPTNFRKRQLQKTFSQACMLLVQLPLMYVLVPIWYMETIFYTNLSTEIFCNCHVAVFFETSVLKKSVFNILYLHDTILVLVISNPASIYLLKVNKGNTRARRGICSTLTRKTREWRHEPISHLVLVFLFLILNM